MNRSERCFAELDGAVNFLTEQGYEVVFCGLYGAQNYNMDTPASDFDFKAVVLPTLEDIVYNRKPVSTSLEFGTGLVDVKDIRCMMDCWKKQNVNFVELLFTEWKYVNPKFSDFYSMIENRELIAHSNEESAVKCVVGMCLEKQHALCHDYPTQHEQIEKYGYAAKQLAHIIRLHDLIERYPYEPYENILVPRPELNKEIIAIKTYKKVFTPEEAQAEAKRHVDAVTEFVNSRTWKNPVKETLSMMDRVKFNLIKTGLKSELLDCE
jgi:predicted nucleotidyltransferase